MFWRFFIDPIEAPWVQTHPLPLFTKSYRVKPKKFTQLSLFFAGIIAGIVAYGDRVYIHTFASRAEHIFAEHEEYSLFESALARSKSIHTMLDTIIDELPHADDPHDTRCQQVFHYPYLAADARATNELIHRYEEIFPAVFHEGLSKAPVWHDRIQRMLRALWAVDRGMAVIRDPIACHMEGGQMVPSLLAARSDIETLIQALSAEGKSQLEDVQSSANDLRMSAEMSLYIISIGCMVLWFISLLLSVRANNRAWREDAKRQEAVIDQVQTILQHVGDGVGMYCEDGQFLDANEEFFRIVGLLGGDRNKAIKRILHHSRSGARDISWDAGQGNIYIRILPIPIDSGVVMTLRDITQETIRQNSHREILSRLAHILNTPLNTINGFSDLLAMSEDTDAARYGVTIGRAGESLKQCIAEFMRLDRLINGETEKTYQPLLADYGNMFQHPLLLAKHIRLAVHEDNTVVHMDADLRRIVEHLIVNAFEAAPEGWDVTVSIEKGEEVCAIVVSDTGDGIPHLQDMLGRIRGGHIFIESEHTKNQSERLGIGLSLAHAFVRAHGGRLDIERTHERTIVRIIFKNVHIHGVTDVHDDE